MRKINYLFLLAAFVLPGLSLFAQNANQAQKATLIVNSEKMVEITSIASQIASGTFIAAENIVKEFNPKKAGKNIAVPGKGLPKGDDPLWQKQVQVEQTKGKAPILTFEAASSGTTPTDPTGAVGPNHFVNAWNTSFRIWDKAGNPLVPAASLGTILNGTTGDPIVIYDRWADRFIITEFYHDGFSIAVCQGSDPVNDGWYQYNYNTNSFPDYPKFSVWSDGYYITANKDTGSAGSSEVVFATERDKMLIGDASALMIGFPLTGIVTSGFYSPLSFNANGPTLPPAGNSPIIYMQDDSWGGVSTDHLKIWNINVNWSSPGSSTISSPQIINTAPFDGLFDGGSFSNIPQPSGGDVDCLQATIMYMAQYRRFGGYNSTVLNFVVDLDGGDDYSGIRWYELRQTNDGDPWTIYQEGTYVQPDGHSAFSGNMCMDASGNIALAYTTVSTSLFPSLRYTGRFASDPLGTMTMAEEVIGNGTQIDPSTRYGDYSQMTIDPTDDATFWSIGEFFNGGSRKNQVGVFQFAPPVLTAEFSANETTACPNQAITFTDASIGSPTSWSWSFPGGSPSSYNGQNPPAITYATSGTYTVSLTVGDGVDTDDEIKLGYISIQDVIADFSGTPTSVVIGNTVTFSDNSSCNPTSWSWSFPGGSPSSFNGQNPPPIQYDVEGTYDVTLAVTNTLGNDTKILTDYITALPPEFNMADGTITTCMGNFYDSGGPSSDYDNGEDFTMTFYPSTSGSMIRFNFSSFDVENQTTCNYDKLSVFDGEDASATLIGEYCGTTSPGIITASNGAGALTFTFTSDGSVTNPGWIAAISCYSATDPPVAEFIASSTTPPLNSTVVFTDQTSNLPTSWSWSFNPTSVVYVNSTDASSQNPEVQFTTAGPYSVTLTATNAFGSDDEIKTAYINPIDCTVSNFPYTESFDTWPTSTPGFNCTADGSIAFSNCWTNIVGDDIDWDIISGPTGSGSTGPTTDHSGSGNYLYTESSSCFSSTGHFTSPVFDLTSFTASTLSFWYHLYGADMGTMSVQVSIDGGTTWSSDIWSLSGDQGNSWQEANVSLTPYISSSNLVIRFKGLTGTDYTSDMAIDDIMVSGNNSNLPPVADFSASSTTPTINTDVTFTDLSSNDPISWSWNFNPASIVYVNGTDASSQDPEVQFTALGFYTVTLVATNTFGSDTEIKTNYINVNNCTYCVTSYSNQTDDWISNVVFNTIDKSSGSEPGGYADYTSESTTVDLNSSYDLYVDVDVDGSWTQHTWAWIDWNQNCDFTDPGEAFDLGETDGTTGTHTLTLNITVPGDALPGTTRMRVTERYSTDPEPCTVTTYGEAEDYSVIVSAGGGIQIDLTVLLEGPFNGSGMDTNLNSILPLSQPFNAFPWNYSGTESVAVIPTGAVEWVLIELRDALTVGQANGGSVIARQAGFLRNDGQVIDINENTVLSYSSSVSEGLFVIVYQRNHISVISESALTVSGGVYVYDFSSGENQAHGGTDGHKQLVSGIWGMFSGDGNADGHINSADKWPLWENQSGNEGYLESDYNVDGQSNNIDKDDYWEPNEGKNSQVPN